MVGVNSNRLKYLRNKCKKNDDISISFKLFHQNIRGIKGKMLMFSLLNEEPNIICLPEHHLNVHERDVVHTPKYKHGASYCRKKHNGSVCIFIHEDLNFTALNVQKYSKGHDIEISTIELELSKGKIMYI
jgi:hypothetical protein